MTKIWQKITQITLLVLFAILILTGKMQLWMGLFVLSVILALFFSRFYCGWLCPINTLMKTVTWIKRKLKLGELKIPRLLRHPFFRYGFLGLFIITLVFVMKTGQKLPLLPVLLILGTGLTLFFPEELWHRYLCPYGTVLHLTGARAGRFLRVEPDECSRCGLCVGVCSGGAIRQNAQEQYVIDRGLCLLCLDCIDKCPQKAIHYQSQNKIAIS